MTSYDYDQCSKNTWKLKTLKRQPTGFLFAYKDTKGTAKTCLKSAKDGLGVKAFIDDVERSGVNSPRKHNLAPKSLS